MVYYMNSMMINNITYDDSVTISKWLMILMAQYVTITMFLNVTISYGGFLK